MARDFDEKTAIKHSFSHEETSPSIPPTSLLQRIPKRYILTFMAFLGFANVYALRVNLSVAIIAMVKNETVQTANGTQILVSPFNWDPRVQGLILGAFFYGYIVTQIPGGWLATRIGGKYLFGCGVLATAVMTILSAPAARVSSYALIAVRIAEGIFEGVTYPCMHAIWSRWCPPNERSRLATIAFSGAHFGTVIAMPLSGVIADKLGWAWIFYIFGLVAIAWFVVWCLVTSESPAEHSTISSEERNYIEEAIGMNSSQNVKGRQGTPWRSIILSLPVWAIICAHFVENWGFYTMLTELPSFLSDVMQYNVTEAGFVGALPYLVMMIMIQVGGYLADMLRNKNLLSPTNIRKVFTCAAFVWQAVFLVVTVNTSSAGAAIACLVLAVSLGGFAWAGFAVNHLDIAPQHAAVLMGISNMFATIPGIISPNLVGYIVSDGLISQWRIVFYVAAAIYVAGAVVYAMLASAEKQSWSEVKEGYQPHVDDQPDTSQQLQ